MGNLRKSLGLPSYFGITHYPLLIPLFQRWTRQYNDFYNDNIYFVKTLEESLDRSGTSSDQRRSSEAGIDNSGSSGSSGSNGDMVVDKAPTEGGDVATEVVTTTRRMEEYLTTPYHSTLAGSHVVGDLEGEVKQEVAEVLGMELYDMSQMGLSTTDRLKLFDLPKQYAELYRLLKDNYWLTGSRAPNVGRGGGNSLEDPAICLVCGAVLSGGPRLIQGRSLRNSVGECTLHARHCGSGTGMFLLVNKGSTLLIRESRAVFYQVRGTSSASLCF